jgi:predicted dehydrogenase
MSKLRVGIVGAGNIAELHALGYEKENRAEIVAICDPDEDAAIRRSLDWGAKVYYNQFADMLADQSIDAVEILTPNYLHASQVIQALQAGKHVSVERPLATTIEDADKVLAAAKASGKVFQVFEPCLYYKPLLDARNLIDAGEIGTPTGLRIDAVIGRSESGLWNFDNPEVDPWRFDSNSVGGSPMLYEVGYQAFCIALFLIGSVEKVNVWRSMTEVAPGRQLDTPTVAMWKHFQQDSYGTLNLTYAPERKMRSSYFPLELEIQVSGTRGDIRVIRSSDLTRIEAPVELHRSNRRVSYGQKSSTFEDSFIRATQNFIGACRGEEEPLLRGVEAKQLLVLTLAFAEAAKRGRAITLQHGG